MGSYGILVLAAVGASAETVRLSYIMRVIWAGKWVDSGLDGLFLLASPILASTGQKLRSSIRASFKENLSPADNLL